MERLNKICLYLNRALLCIGGIFLVGMIILTCANIFFRWVWVPVRGTFELMGFFGSIVAAFVLGYTQIKEGHVTVGVLVNIFPVKIKKILRMINAAVCMCFFCVASWQIVRLATILWNSGEVTETLRIIYYPFTYGVAVGCAVLALVFLIDLINTFLSPKRNER